MEMYVPEAICTTVCYLSTPLIVLFLNSSVPSDSACLWYSSSSPCSAFAPRTWCSFCPMGSLSSWVAPKKAPLPKAYKSIHVSSQCEEKCKLCARVCPMQLTPYSSRGEQLGYLHPDCLKCRKCEKACPTKIIKMKGQFE